MGSLSIWHWLVVLLVVAMIFGTSRLKNIGRDLGAAVKGFRDGSSEEPAAAPQPQARPQKEIAQEKEKA